MMGAFAVLWVFWGTTSLAGGDYDLRAWGSAGHFYGCRGCRYPTGAKYAG